MNANDDDSPFARILNAGWGGVKVWAFTKADGTRDFMGCLVRDDADMTADYSTNLWSYTHSFDAVLIRLADKAEQVSPSKEKTP